MSRRPLSSYLTTENTEDTEKERVGNWEPKLLFFGLSALCACDENRRLEIRTLAVIIAERTMFRL